MLLTSKLKTLNNTGAPDYTICGQATSNLDLTNLSLKLAVGKNDSPSYTIVDTSDLSTYVAAGLPVTYTFGNYDIKVTSFVTNNANSAFQLKIEVFFTGTTDVVTWERFNLFMWVSKTGYQPFHNVFELYNYDLGNSLTIPGFVDTTDNTDFEVALVNNTDNLDAYGIQTKPGSKLMVIRRPFTNEIHMYNMLGTQGDKSYSNANGVIGTGDHAVYKEEGDELITQRIDLAASYCESSEMAFKKVWWPVVNTGYSSNDTCDECTNDIATTEATYSIDATTLSVFKLHGTPVFLTEFMDHKIVIEIINYLSEIMEDEEYIENLTYAAWVADPTQFLNPVSFAFVPDEVGENVIKFTNLFFYDTTVDIKLMECVTNYKLETCHWWTITAKEACGQYTIQNCSADGITLTIQMMNSDKTWTDLSTTPIAAAASLDITLSTDGIYMLKVVKGVDTEYYSLPSFCALTSCITTALNKVLCNKIDDENCKEEDHYNFNALIIQAHGYFLMLNKEMGGTYIYGSIDAAKLDELYTLKTFIDRFEEYCGDSDSPCVTCNQ